MNWLACRLAYGWPALIMVVCAGSALVCSGLRVVRGLVGAGTPCTVTYGLALQTWCVYLIAAHAIPMHHCAGLIEELTETKPSPGWRMTGTTPSPA